MLISQFFYYQIIFNYIDFLGYHHNQKTVPNSLQMLWLLLPIISNQTFHVIKIILNFKIIIKFYLFEYKINIKITRGTTTLSTTVTSRTITITTNTTVTTVTIRAITITISTTITTITTITIRAITTTITIRAIAKKV